MSLGESGDVGFGEHLGAAVRRHGQELRSLVDEVVTVGAVEAAGRGLHETTHARFLGRVRDAHRAEVIDVEGGRRVEIAERIVRERREVQHGVEAVEVGRRDVAHVLADPRDLGEGASEVAALEQATVEAGHLMARGGEHRYERRADIAAVAGYEYPHRQLHTFQGASPESQSAWRCCLSRNVSMHCQNDSWRYAIS